MPDRAKVVQFEMFNTVPRSLRPKPGVRTPGEEPVYETCPPFKNDNKLRSYQLEVWPRETRGREGGGLSGVFFCGWFFFFLCVCVQPR